MSGNLNLEMRLTANTSQLTTALNSAGTHVRGFASSASQAASSMANGFKRVYQELNGFSAISKLLAGGAALNFLKGAMDSNLAFEKTLLSIKFNAQMTTKELAELRKQAIDLSATSLNSPLETLTLIRTLGNAGLKKPDIVQLAPAIANAAPVFEASPAEIANLVFDVKTKMGVDNKRIPQILDMLYFHATSGRFETMSMAKEAPGLLNAGALSGITGEKGLNLLGALAQRIARNTNVALPSEVTTIFTAGLSHIKNEHYTKGLAKFGIDIQKFFDDKGRFKGEGGNDGFLALVRAMKAAKLDNPFNLAKAGFREQHAQIFWQEAMRSLDAKDSDSDPNLINMMQRGEAAKNSGQLAVNLAEVKEANFGKMKAAEIEVDKLKLSDAGQAGTGGWADLMKWAAQNPVIAGAGTAAGVLGGRWLLKKGLSRLSNTPVTVTNWPASMGKLPARDALMNTLPSGAAAGTAGGAVATAVAGAAAVAAPLAVAYAAKKYFESDSGQNNRAKGLNLEIQRLESRLQSQKGPGYQDKQLIEQLTTQLNQMKADRDAILAKLEAVANRPIELHLDGQKVAESVNKANGRDARRQ